MKSLPFGRYLLLEEIARGGMAVVYRAVLRDDAGFEKQVALKRMLRELSEDQEFITRFADEARIVSTLNHANIAQVFDFGQVGGEYFLAMELVNGPDLGTLLDSCLRQHHPVPIPTAVHIAAEMARGLGAAHGRLNERAEPAPVVHRDVSPQNVLISRAGAVKVVDFGIAKAAEKMLSTRTGTIMGKCRYMAPEQATGEPVDARADVFAAGSVLFEMLTGRPLFDGTSPSQVLRQVVVGPIPLPSSVNPDIPPELDEILLRALSRPLEQRHLGGSALARELEALLHRMAPDYSCDDLAGFIAALVPATPTPAPEVTLRASQGASVGAQTQRDAHTLQVTQDAALSDTVPASRKIAADTRDARTFDVGSGTTTTGDVHAAPTAILTEHPAEPATDPTTEPAEDPGATAGGGQRRLALVAVLLGIVGLLAGLGGRMALAPRAGADVGPTVTARVGSTLRHDRWTIGLQRLQQRERRLLLELTVMPAERARPVGDWFNLVEGGRLRPPLAWSRDQQRLTLLFELSPSPPVLLRFAPPRRPSIVAAIVRR